MKYLIERLLWFGIYFFIILGPVFLLLPGRIAGKNFWWEFSIALGFSMLIIMGLQFALTARFKKATLPFGIDIIYHFHRYMGLVLLLFIFLHPAVFFINSPDMLALLNPLKAPLAFRAGIASALALLFLVLISLSRRKVSMEYDYWRVTHVFLSILAVGAGIIHMRGFGSFNFSWQNMLWTGLILIWVLLVSYMRGLKPFLISKNPYLVEEVRPEPGDSYSISIRPEKPGKGLKFQPGQFAWITIWHSPFALREHPFSIASSAEDETLRLEFTIKERGDFTKRIKSIKPGLRVYVDAPYGSFSPDRYPAPGYVFIAGGIGIAPIMSMLRTFRDRGDKRPLMLFYSNKKYERAPFIQELEKLKQELDLKVINIIENPGPGWQGERGFISRQILEKYLPPERALFHYFICGPDAMMDSVEHNLYAIGISISRFHSELFNLV